MTTNPSPAPDGGFPATPWTAILAAKNSGHPRYRESLERLASQYWRSVYWWIRKKNGCGDDEARDLTQEFFAGALEREILRSTSPEKGRFRTFLLYAVRNFLANQRERESAQKRGGDRTLLRLEELCEDRIGWDPPDRSLTPEQVYDLCWKETLMKRAWEEVEAELRRTGRALSAEIFRRMVLAPPPGGPPSYKELAREFSIGPIELRDRLVQVKKMLRVTVRRLIQEYVSSSDDLERELRELFGAGE